MRIRRNFHYSFHRVFKLLICITKLIIQKFTSIRAMRSTYQLFGYEKDNISLYPLILSLFNKILIMSFICIDVYCEVFFFIFFFESIFTETLKTQ